jgi:hypothetical protein
MNYVVFVASKGRMIANDELERIWKEAVVSCLKVLSCSLYRGTEEIARESQSESPDS